MMKRMRRGESRRMMLLLGMYVPDQEVWCNRATSALPFHLMTIMVMIMMKRRRREESRRMMLLLGILITYVKSRRLPKLHRYTIRPQPYR